MEAVARTTEIRLMNRMNKYTNSQIQKAAFAERERIAGRYLLELVPMDMRTILGCSTIIKKMQRKKIKSRNRRQNRSPPSRLIHKFGTMLLNLEKTIDLEAETHNMLHITKYDLSNLETTNPSHFPIYPNERYVQAFAARSDLGMITQSQAEQKTTKPNNDIQAALGTKKIHDIKETVRTFYHISYLFTDMFFGNPLRKEYGAPPDWDQTKILPLQLKEFMSGFEYDENGIATCNEDRFESLARKKFGVRYQDFERNFVISDKCPNAFPLFLKTGNKTLLSRFFSEFYIYPLLPVIHRREFDRETERRSLEYETAVVPAHFREMGFTYHANQGKKNDLEIDGIAVSAAVTYVIEAKYWNPRKFLGSAGRYNAFDDVIRNSIDGVHLERGTGKITKRGVALIDKVKWVETKRDIYNIPKRTPIKCMLVTNTHPNIRKYCECKITRVPDPDALNALPYHTGGRPA